MTAALGLYHHLRLPQPFVPLINSEKPMPLLIYSGASAVGAYAIKMARLSNIHPIIAVAGNGIPFVQTLLDPSKGDAVVDYRLGSEAIVNGVKEAVKEACGQNGKIEYALDAATYKGSWDTVTAAMDGKGAATFVLPDYRDKDLPGTLKTSMTFVGAVHKNEEGNVMGTMEFGYVWFRLLSRGLQEGWMTPHPYEIVPGGLNGLEKALVQLKAGKTSAKKLIISVGAD